MASEQFQRKLAAILAADVVGYSRLIGVDEEGTRMRRRSIQVSLGAIRNMLPSVLTYKVRNSATMRPSLRRFRGIGQR